MFRILERAVTEHKYEMYQCWLNGPKAGMRAKVEVKINETTVRVRAEVFCEIYVAGIWVSLSDKGADDVIEAFNEVRAAKGWSAIEFPRLSSSSSNEEIPQVSTGERTDLHSQHTDVLLSNEAGGASNCSSPFLLRSLNRGKLK